MEDKKYEGKRVSEQWLTVLLKRIEELPEGMRIIAIDGRCASGKTSLAEVLGEHLQADVIHMDDFFLPISLRTEERHAQPGGNVHYERFLQEVIPFLKSGEAFAYRKFDCSRMELGAECKVRAARVRIVEGAYSCHPLLGSYMDLRVFLDVDAAVQQERIRIRNGEEKLMAFREKWIPLEEAYFKAFRIKENTHIVLE